MNDIDIFGIDLGTTNSVIAIWEPETGQTRILRNQEGERLTPSVVMVDNDPSCTVVVGKQAAEKMMIHPDNVIYSVKRFIGCTFRDQCV